MRWRCFVFKQNFLSSREIKSKNQTMNRTFQSKVGWWYWIVIGITSVLLFFFFWEHYLLCTILCATVVIFEIEMLIHTQYVITEDGWLKVETQYYDSHGDYRSGNHCFHLVHSQKLMSFQL